MALEGTLQDMSMSDLFQIFRMGPKSGVLLVNYEEERGVIYVDRGRLIDAFVVRGAERHVVATRDEAVLHMLEWENGDFVFRHDLSARGRTLQIEHDGEWLVLESMRRRADPLRALPYHKITLDTRLQLSPMPTNAENSVSLDVDQWRILSHAANHQDVRTICAATGIAHDKALRIVAELLSIGLVEIAPQQPSTPPRSSPPAQNQPASEKKHQAAASLDMDLPGASATNATSAEHRETGRSLLNAIMRRINEL
jgi:hypothetical protein